MSVQKYDINKKTASLVGTTKDAVLALYVTRNRIREFDKSLDNNKKRDISHIGIEINDKHDEEIKEEQKETDDKQYYVCCVDESEYLNIFSHKTT